MLLFEIDLVGRDLVDFHPAVVFGRVRLENKRGDNMIYKEEPEDFSPRFEVVSCFIDVGGQILFFAQAGR
jgi:hypothetical protein